MIVVERLLDSGLVPERVLRAGIRTVCALRLREARGIEQDRLVAELRGSELAIATDAANVQHYEVPTRFFERVLGPKLKYSACYWPAEVTTLAEAETAMLELYAERAELADGQDILELGCGWGSFALWAAARYPASRIVAISNSRSQRQHVARQAASRGLANVVVRTADVRALELPARSFDRVISIEMFEHVRNYAVLLRRIAGWLRPTGSLFVHVFAHRRYAYAFEDRGPTDWMAREFFTGGMMPSARLFESFQDDLAIVARWQLAGTHYARTAEAWHRNLLARRAELVAVLGDRRRYHRWRVFFLACAELFGYAGGSEWGVAHYRFAPR